MTHKATCDAVMGRPGTLAHRCNRKAKVVSRRTIFIPSEGEQPYRLHYCSKHEKRANVVDLSILRVVSVEAL